MGWIWPVDHNLPTPNLVSLEGGLALFVQNTRLSTGLAIPLAGIYPTIGLHLCKMACVQSY